MAPTKANIFTSEFWNVMYVHVTLTNLSPTMELYYQQEYMQENPFIKVYWMSHTFEVERDSL